MEKGTPWLDLILGVAASTSLPACGPKIGLWEMLATFAQLTRIDLKNGTASSFALIVYILLDSIKMNKISRQSKRKCPVRQQPGQLRPLLWLLSTVLVKAAFLSDFFVSYLSALSS